MYVWAALHSTRTSLQNFPYILTEWKEEAQTGSFQLCNTTHLTSSVVRKTQSNLIELITAETLTQQASRSSKCAEKLLVLQTFFCIAASAIGLLIIFTFL